jgi:NAD(P)H-flavin reductase
VTAHDPLVPQVFRVARRRRESDDVVTLDLHAPEGVALAGAAGQFNMLYAFGVGEVPISISNDPAAGDVVTHTLRSVGPVSRALSRLKKGDAVGVRGPFGTGWPVAESEGRDVLLVAGGLGLLPIRSALLRLLARRKAYGRVRLLYGARSPDDIVYKSDLKRWLKNAGIEVEVTVDHAGPDWTGHVGVVTKLISSVASQDGDGVALVCGPGLMMRFTVKALEDNGFRADQIYLSLERNMKCAVAWCGRCQYGPAFVCKNGPVFRFDRIAHLFRIADI